MLTQMMKRSQDWPRLGTRRKIETLTPLGFHPPGLDCHGNEQDTDHKQGQGGQHVEAIHDEQEHQLNLDLTLTLDLVLFKSENELEQRPRSFLQPLVNEIRIWCDSNL